MSDAPVRVTVAAMPEPVVSVVSVTKRFGGLVAVDDLTFHLDAGTVTGFLGPNGAGKTTTLRILLGLTAQSSGTAHVFGRRYHDLADPMRRVGAVLEANDFHPGRKGRDHLRDACPRRRHRTARVSTRCCASSSSTRRGAAG